MNTSAASPLLPPPASQIFLLDPARTRCRFAALGAAAFAVVCFHAACTLPGAGFLILGFLYGLLPLGRLLTWRRSFYLALAIGLAIYAPQLRFFASIFGAAALVLWLILAFYLGLFAVLFRAALNRFGPGWAALLAPVIWTGLEYFRSELYYLRFTWLNVGFAFADTPGWIGLARCGAYGAGFLLMGVAAFAWWLRPQRGLPLLLAVILATTASAHWLAPPTAPADRSLRIAGAQLEAPTDDEVIKALDQLVAEYPETDLFVLSEYTYQTPPPASLLEWCRRHRRHALVGGREPVDDHRYYNTAFVIDPNGAVVFRQAKSVPIQFFQDGLPAPTQTVWHSPWGPLGVAVCYDLSYARVTDRLASLGARALLVPTMDVAEWGENEFQLHTRVAPVRSVEYGVPIVRVSSSGISQVTGVDGRALATPNGRGQGATIAATIALPTETRLPWDRYLAPAATAATAGIALALAILSLQRRPPPMPGPAGPERAPGGSTPPAPGAPCGPPMRLLLIAPASGRWRHVGRRWPFNGRTFRFSLLSLLSVAAETPPGVEIRLVDEQVDDIPWDDPVSLVGITCMTAAAPRAYEIAARFRARGVSVVLGGLHPTLCPDEALRHADAIVEGEAEGLWAQVVHDARAGTLSSRYSRSTPHDLRGLAPIPRHLLQPRRYATVHAVQATRGCPHTCTFCSVSAFHHAAQRRRPVQDVVDEVRRIPARFFIFVDDNLTADPAYASELFGALAPLRKQWVVQSTLAMAEDENLVRLAARAGCVGVFVGLETFSADNLESVHKNCHRVEHYRAAIRRFHAHGIGVEAGVVFGFSHDRPDVFRRTLSTLESLGIDAVQISILTPLPGTPMFSALQDRILDRNWSHYDFHHAVFEPAHLTVDALQAGHDWITREFYRPWRIVRRMARTLLRPRGWRTFAFVTAVNWAYFGRVQAWHIRGWDPASEGVTPRWEALRPLLRPRPGATTAVG